MTVGEDIYLCQSCLGNDKWFQWSEQQRGQCASCLHSKQVSSMSGVAPIFEAGFAAYIASDEASSHINRILREDFGILASIEDELVSRISGLFLRHCGLDSQKVSFSLRTPSGTIYPKTEEAEWKDFCTNLRSGNRYFDDSELFSQKEGIGSPLSEAVRLAVFDVVEGYSMVRARSFYDVPADISDRDLREPPSELASSGRLNSHGISHFYAASDEGTALAEVRSEVGSCIILGRFRTKAPLRVVDLSKIRRPFPLDGDIDYRTIRSIRFLENVRGALERPGLGSPLGLDYLPTQYFSEFVKYLGYDGIVWNSVQAKGENILLFSSSGVHLQKISSFVVTAVSVEVEAASVSS